MSEVFADDDRPRNRPGPRDDLRGVRRSVKAPGRLTGLAFVALTAVAPMVRPAPTHGGSSSAVTSNYRVELNGVSPTVTGLHVEIADVDGTLRLTWRGTGTLTVDGYDGEPYLRIGSAGVERNVRSPATYLNQNRYARVEIPATADSSAAPQWQTLSDGPDRRVARPSHALDGRRPAGGRAGRSVGRRT